MKAFRIFPALSAVGLWLVSVSAQAANHPINLPSSNTANGTLPSSTTANCTEIPPGAGAPVCFLITNTNTSTSDTYAIAGISNSVNGTGVNGHSDNGKGVQGESLGSGIGVYGHSQGYLGVFGDAPNSNGVQGHSASAGNSGVYGYNDSAGGFGTAGRIFGTTNTGKAIYGDNASPNGWAGYFDGQVHVQGNITASGSITAGSSDARLKKNVKPLGGSLNHLLQLHGVTFEWKDPAEHGNQVGTQQGFIAQDVEKVMPQWIGVDNKGFKTIAIPGRSLEAMFVESIRELKAQNDELRERVNRLEQRAGVTTTSAATKTLGAGAMLGLLPIGFVVMGYRRKRATKS